MPESIQPERTERQVAEEEAGGRMSFFDHLVELRKRIVSALIGVGAGIIVGLLVSKRFISLIVEPMQAALRANHLDDKLYYTSPAGYISLVINLGVYLGIVIAMPWVLYQVWLFVAPGLYKHERRAAAGFIVSSMFLFLRGIAFGYFILLPQMLHFLIGFAYDGPVKPLISINEYFEPDPDRARRTGLDLRAAGADFYPVAVRHRHAEVPAEKFPLRDADHHSGAAIITPTPDATTMLIFMAPMIVLYFVGVFVSYAVVRKKRARELAEGGVH